MFDTVSVEIPTSCNASAQCSYLLWRPAGAGAAGNAQSLPVLFLFTGRREIRTADTVKDWVFEDSHLDPMVKMNFLIVVPLVAEGSSLLRCGTCAKCVEQDVGWNNVNIDAMWQLLRAAVARLGSGVDTARVCITGFSLGAETAVQLAIRYGRHLAAVVPFCSSFDTFPECADDIAGELRGLAMRIIHAVGDTFIPVAKSTELFEWLCRLYQVDVSVCQAPALSFPDPVAPTWDQAATIDVEVSEFGGWGCPVKSVWLLQDYVYRGDDDRWNGYRKPREHVIWPMFYTQERTFGLFTWMLSQRSALSSDQRVN